LELTGALDNGRHNPAVWMNWIVLVDLHQHMSESGQKRKSSVGAYVFRFAPGSGHRQLPQPFL
jgi:hypothetical protein